MHKFTFIPHHPDVTFPGKNSLLIVSVLKLPNSSLPGSEENVGYGLQQAV